MYALVFRGIPIFFIPITDVLWNLKNWFRRNACKRSIERGSKRRFNILNRTTLKESPKDKDDVWFFMKFEVFSINNRLKMTNLSFYDFRELKPNWSHLVELLVSKKIYFRYKNGWKFYFLWKICYLTIGFIFILQKSNPLYLVDSLNLGYLFFEYFMLFWTRLL